jgi:hypothetical protein
MLYRLREFAPSRRSRSLRERLRSRLRLEELETRNLLSVFTPAAIRQAYGLDQTGLDGSGQTIAIIDAYDNAAIIQNLNTFNSQFGLPQFNGGPGSPTFTKATPGGQPQIDTGWAGEIALDVEWAHAIAPKANLLLVEAASANLNDLVSAVQYAARQPGVSVVSMSWGTSEFAGETNYDGAFTTPAGHTGVTFVASSGDSGAWYGTEWPAVSPNVVSVGGTALTINAGGGYGQERSWSSSTPLSGGSGGGVSQFESEPAYQEGVQQTGARTVPDVAYNASPSTSYAVYDQANGGWLAVGGTSAGAPQWAGVVAQVNQGRAQQGLAPLDGPTQTLPALYQMGTTSSSTYFHDVTTGGNGYRAGTGYDLVTGLGTPQGAAVVHALANVHGSGANVSLTTTTSTGPVTPPTKTKTTRTVHHHDVTTTTGTTPVSGTTPAPVATASNPAPVLVPVGTLPVRTTTPPVFVQPASATPASGAAAARATMTALTVAPSAPAPAAVNSFLGTALSGGGGDNAELPPDDGPDQVPQPPDMPAPDILPDVRPADLGIADKDEAGAPTRTADRDAYFLAQAGTSDGAEAVEAAAPVVKPLAAVALTLLLGGSWGEATTPEARRQAAERARRQWAVR